MQICPFQFYENLNGSVIINMSDDKVISNTFKRHKPNVELGIVAFFFWNWESESFKTRNAFLHTNVCSAIYIKSLIN